MYSLQAPGIHHLDQALHQTQQSFVGLGHPHADSRASHKYTSIIKEGLIKPMKA